jgi:hypothetical protein
MLPIWHPTGKVSPWMFAENRPVMDGYYECKFYTTGDSILTLKWGRSGFWYGDCRVQMRDLLTWRGKWA